MSNALRAYLRELRKKKGISQDRLADEIGLSRQALIDFEKGRTDDIKSTNLFRAASFLGASVLDIQYLMESGVQEEDGERMALERSLKPVVPQNPQRDDLLVRVIDLAMRWRYDPRLSKLAAYGERLLQEKET